MKDSQNTTSHCGCGPQCNPSIECTVKNCSYHCKNEDYCTLDHIKVGAHEPSPKTADVVDCRSFRPSSC